MAAILSRPQCVNKCPCLKGSRSTWLESGDPSRLPGIINAMQTGPLPSGLASDAKHPQNHP